MHYDHIELPGDGEAITMNTDFTLNVPARPIVPVIEGDGIGIDVTPVMKDVVDAAVSKAYGGERAIAWMEVFAGQMAAERYQGQFLPEETLDALRRYVVSIKGPLATPVGGGFRSLNVSIRQTLDLYACVRPIQYFPGVQTPMKDSDLVSMTIFRENTEDIYAGIEWPAGSPEGQKLIKFLQEELGVTGIRFPSSSGLGIKPVSREGSQRLIRKAINYAVDEDRNSVTLVHKGNIMKFTEGAFRNWGYELAEREFPGQTYTWDQWERTKAEKGGDAANAEQQAALDAGKILIKDAIADITLQQVLTRPREFEVIATMNLNGDYLSDALAAQVGGIGIAPGGNINYTTGHAVFEATHGTAPKYANLDKVNPGSLILSGEMMLRYMGWTEAADRIIAAMDVTIGQRVVTYDFARLMEGAKEVKCSEFGDALIGNM